MEPEKITITEEKETFMDRIKEINPKQLLIPIIIVIIFIGTIFGIVNYQQKSRQNRNPKIEITDPKDGKSYEEAQIMLTGTTYADTKVAVNGKPVTVDKKGKFSTELPLILGSNDVIITAESQTGKKTEVKKTVLRVAPQPVIAEAVPTEVGGVVTTQNGSLNPSGPENFWIPEALSLSGVGAAWYMSKKNLKKAIKK